MAASLVCTTGASQAAPVAQGARPRGPAPALPQGAPEEPPSSSERIMNGATEAGSQAGRQVGRARLREARAGLALLLARRALCAAPHAPTSPLWCPATRVRRCCALRAHLSAAVSRAAHPRTPATRRACRWPRAGGAFERALAAILRHLRHLSSPRGRSYGAGHGAGQQEHDHTQGQHGHRDRVLRVCGQQVRTGRGVGRSASSGAHKHAPSPTPPAAPWHASRTSLVPGGLCSPIHPSARAAFSSSAASTRQRPSRASRSTACRCVSLSPLAHLRATVSPPPPLR